MSEDKVQPWLIQVLSGLVGHPEDIKIVRNDDEMGVKYTIEVHPDDRGRVIGKGGKIAQATRVLLHSVGYHEGMRASMVISVPGSKFVPREEAGVAT